MPKKVDYAVRFAFLREAAFQVVRDRGVDALSRRALAAELGVPLATVRRLLAPGARLDALALDEIETRERRAHLTHGRAHRDDPPMERATSRVLGLLPRDADGLATTLVWLKLTLADPTVSERVTVATEEGALAARFQVVERGFADDEQDTGAAGHIETGGSETGESHDDDVPRRLQDRLDAERRVLSEALAMIDQEHPDQLVLLTAVVHGLALDLCLGVRTLGEARATLAAHLAQLG